MKNGLWTAIVVGCAMFSMFFGSGNVIYPLFIGQQTTDSILVGMLGFLLTGVIVPFMGVFGIVFFNGNYTEFLERIGKIPGFLLMVFIMTIIGPFGVVPRCITVSYSTFNTLFVGTSLPLFSTLSTLILLFLCYKKNQVIGILGKYLTPGLLLALFVIIVKGFFFTPLSVPLLDDHGSMFEDLKTGLVNGYYPMDLLGAFFFSSFVAEELGHTKGKKFPFKKMFLASSIGGGLLALVYVSLGYLAYVHKIALDGVPQAELLGKLSILLLGNYAAIVANLIVILACLTTAIALMTVFNEFMSREVFKGKVSEHQMLIVSSIITLIFSMMEFSGIMRFLGPILEIIYPAMIVLTICNLFEKVFKVSFVKIPFTLTLAGSFLFYFRYLFL